MLRSGDNHWEHHPVRGLGGDGMMNKCEDLINLVNFGKPKMLTGFSQTGAVGGLFSSSSDNTDAKPTGGKGPSNPSIRHSHGTR